MGGRESCILPSDAAATHHTLAMMLPRLFPALLPLLLSLRTAPIHGSMTFAETDRDTGRRLVCDRCPPGKYLRAPCTSTSKSECAPCPPGSFTELWNHIRRCLRCAVCGQNQEVKAACAADRDCQCACKQGYYYKAKYDMCVRHSACPSGQGALTQGTADEDTVCHVCPNGTYSDSSSAHQNCTVHRSCGAAGLQLVLRGSTWHDSVCTSAGDAGGRDAASYLKEILPAFFVHQNMPVRRLRHVLNNLPSEDGKKQAGASSLDRSELHARINARLAAATANQIRQLPAILTKTGANGASVKLENKLQRIESNMKELSSLRNEVDVVLMQRDDVEHNALEIGPVFI